MMLSSVWWNELYLQIYLLLRPMLKWLLHKVTGKCELLRIAYGETDVVERTIQIENSLKSSNDQELKRLAVEWDTDIDEAVKIIMTKKDIVSEVHSGFDNKVCDSLVRIRAYSKMLSEAESLRQIKYSADREDHELRLLELWSAWQADPLPSRVGDHWGTLGFQGTDPKTDFRGMGMLGLEQLLFFAKHYPSEAKQVLSQSQHPKLGFSLAIVGINLTLLGHDMLSKQRLRSHFYSLAKQPTDLNDFHQVYCYLLYEFTQFWVSENPRDIMEFNRLRTKFKRKVKSLLKDPATCVLLSSFQKGASYLPSELQSES